MNQILTSTAEAMRVAFELSELLRRPVWRHVGVNKHGATVWIVIVR